MRGYEIHINGEHVGTLYDDGDIYSGGKCVGHLYGDGEIYSGGVKVGSMGSDGSIWDAEGNSGYRVYGDGDIYYYGRCVGSIWGYEQFRSQRNPSSAQQNSSERSNSGSGFADKAAGAAAAAGTAAAAGAGCEGVLIAFVVVGLIVAAFVNWAISWIGYVLFFGAIAFVVYMVVKRSGKARAFFDSTRANANARWNAMKADRTAKKEQRSHQHDQGQASQKTRGYAKNAVYTCPKCGQKMSAPDVQAQIKITCPQCGTITMFNGSSSAQRSGQASSSSGKSKFKPGWAAGLVVLFLVLIVAIPAFETGGGNATTTAPPTQSSNGSSAKTIGATTGTSGNSTTASDQTKVTALSNEYYRLSLPANMSDAEVKYEEGRMSGTTAVGATTTVTRNGSMLFQVSCFSNDWGPQGTQGNARIGIPSKASSCTVYVVVPAQLKQGGGYDTQTAQDQAKKYAAYVTLL